MALMLTTSGTARGGRKFLIAALLCGAALPAQAQTGAAAEAEAEAAADQSAGDEVVVTGLRGRPRSVADSPAPIDVVASDQLQTVGRGGMQEALNALLPSYNLPAMSGAGSGGVVRAAGLRGLNSDHALILVNGKRRHVSALIQSGSWTSSGSNPVDLDLIPSSAIGRMEVLRDGASAQYGSDAISGVINVILNTGANAGQVYASAGQNYKGDGFTWEAGASKGVTLGSASLFLAYEHQFQENYTRSEPAVRLGFDSANKIVPVATEVINFGYGNPRVVTDRLLVNFEAPLSDNAEFYAFGTAAKKEGWKHANFRQPTANGNILSLYPEGGSARAGIKEKDGQLTAGIRWTLGEWKVDTSSSYARDVIRQYSHNTLNPTFGPASPKNFYIGAQKFTQWTNNLDVGREIAMGGAKAQISFGAEHRYEKWEQTQGQRESYAEGGYIYTSGPYAGRRPDQSAGVRGVGPGDADSASRNILAAYGEFDMDFSDKLFLGVAVRHERYNDSAGDTTNGKLTARWEVVDGLAFRATGSTGFRAPSVAQLTYQQSSVSPYQATSTGFVQYYYKLLAPGSEIATKLGSRPLTPEKSKNISLGATFNGIRGLNLTVDAYQIDLDDRIVRSSTLLGAAVVSILDSYGLRDYNGAEYYVNAVDTRTRGIDIVGEYRASLGSMGDARFSLAYNYNKTDIRKIANIIVPGTTSQIFNHSSQVYLTDGNPHTKLIAAVNWSLGGFNVNARMTRYGQITQPGATVAADRTFGAKWIGDLQLSYDLNDHVGVAVGANNLFNVYPDPVGIVSSTGLGRYGYISPFGFGGGYYYGRMTYKF